MESSSTGVSFSAPLKGSAGGGASGVVVEPDNGVGTILGDKLDTGETGTGASAGVGAGAGTGTGAGAGAGAGVGAGAGAISAAVDVFFNGRSFSGLFAWMGGNFGGGIAEPIMGTPSGTTGGAVFIAIARATIRGSGMIPFSAASRAASTARPFLLRPSRSRFFFGPVKRDRQPDERNRKDGAYLLSRLYPLST